MKTRQWAIGLAAIGSALAALGATALAARRRRPAAPDGHAAPDLAADATPGERAPVAFRPDMDAPMTAEEREALRPSTMPSTATSLPG